MYITKNKNMVEPISFFAGIFLGFSTVLIFVTKETRHVNKSNSYQTKKHYKTKTLPDLKPPDIIISNEKQL